ncbi:hypothetical protein B0J18DRAFT_266546 [Chaetomium sp. MPI-SDFR-AT-0129]|nr:hypothetical protein B0J18DRAFT_266546 [Chaetomium sp. MPI-SDFR-AT-0129]
MLLGPPPSSPISRKTRGHGRRARAETVLDFRLVNREPHRSGYWLINSPVCSFLIGIIPSFWCSPPALGGPGRVGVCPLWWSALILKEIVRIIKYREFVLVTAKLISLLEARQVVGFTGICVFPGIAIGPCHLCRPNLDLPPGRSRPSRLAVGCSFRVRSLCRVCRLIFNSYASR